MLYTIGEELPAGTYTINSNLDNDACYWARLDSSSGDIIENHFGLQTGSFTAAPGEVLELNGCGYITGPTGNAEEWSGAIPVESFAADS